MHGRTSALAAVVVLIAWSDVRAQVPPARDTYTRACAACHGPDGQGNQALNAPPLTIPNDWYLLKQLQNLKQKVRGGDAPRDAAGAMMQPIASTLSEQAMQDVIAYIQTLR